MLNMCCCKASRWYVEGSVCKLQYQKFRDLNGNLGGVCGVCGGMSGAMNCCSLLSGENQIETFTNLLQVLV